MTGYRFARIFGLILWVSLMLGAAPREAGAIVCDRLGEGAGCVVSRDVAGKAVRAKQRLDEAGAEFDWKDDTASDINGAAKIYASVEVDAPAPGTVIVNASLSIQGLENMAAGGDGEGTVECALTDGGAFFDMSNFHRFWGRVEWAKGLEYRNMAITRGFNVTTKGPVTIALSCKVLAGSGTFSGEQLIRVRAPSISAAYYANLN